MEYALKKYTGILLDRISLSYFNTVLSKYWCLKKSDILEEIFCICCEFMVFFYFSFET